jgi:hypothetical protein
MSQIQKYSKAMENLLKTDYLNKIKQASKVDDIKIEKIYNYFKFRTLLQLTESDSFKLL